MTNIKLLKALKKARKPISGETIAKELGISRTAVWKQVENLRKAGYDVEGHSKVGYRLKFTPDKISSDELEIILPTEFKGRVVCVDTVDSTNNLAKNIAANDRFKPVGLVVAEEQAVGRGRFGRVWFSPRGGIWMSLVVRPRISAALAGRASIMTAVAVVEAIIENTGLPAKIKWPNDILLDGKKVCGILIEMAAELSLVEYLVIGIGLNANFDIAELSNKIEVATTLKAEMGRSVERVKLISQITSKVLKWLPHLGDGFDKILQRWKELSMTIDKDVQLEYAGKVISGRVLDINQDGALIVKLASGERRIFQAGEVTFSGEGT